jgi:hypothetical protein
VTGAGRTEVVCGDEVELERSYQTRRELFHVVADKRLVLELDLLAAADQLFVVLRNVVMLEDAGHPRLALGTAKVQNQVSVRKLSPALRLDEGRFTARADSSRAPVFLLGCSARRVTNEAHEMTL